MEFLKPEPLKTEGNLSENFKFFRDEIDFYFTVTETDKLSRELQVEMLRNLLGSEGWELYRSLTTEGELEETVDSILSILESHCVPHSCTIMDIFNFLLRKQQWGEPVEEFLADLKHLVKLCEFGDQESKLLQYQIVMGIYSTGLQTRLLQKDLSLDETIRIATCKPEEKPELDEDEDIDALEVTNVDEEITENPDKSKNS